MSRVFLRLNHCAAGEAKDYTKYEVKVSELEVKEGPLLTAETPGQEKMFGPHKPLLTISDGKAMISVQHGCTDAHYVGTLYARDQNGKLIYYEELKPGKAAKPINSKKFQIPSDCTSIIAFEWCNIDGIYMADPVKL